jgi:hypothetical protein
VDPDDTLTPEEEILLAKTERQMRRGQYVTLASLDDALDSRNLKRGRKTASRASAEASGDRQEGLLEMAEDPFHGLVKALQDKTYKGFIARFQGGTGLFSCPVTRTAL